MFIDPTLSIVLRILFALLFITAAISKLDGTRFRALLQAYRLIPEPLLGVVARALPVVEMALGIGWAFGIFTVGVAIVSMSLLGIYLLAIAVNLLRGNDNIDCGCGFGKSGQRLSWGLVGRNLFLLALATLAILPTTSRTLQFTDYFTALTATVAALLVYGALNQLLSNHADMAIWRRPREVTR